MEQILEWALAVIGSGGLGACITYLFTFKSQKKKTEAEAESTVVEVEKQKEELKHDQYDYLQKTCDKYIKDYHELEGEFRRQLSGLRDQIDSLMLEKSQVIQEKCNEIAELKSKVTYLKGIRCYDFTCPNRLKTNSENP